MSEHDADCELLGPGKYCTCGLDALMGRLLVDSLRGAIAAQDEREQQAGAKCGVPYELSGCDWPDAVAEEVLSLCQELAAMQHRAEAAENDWQAAEQQIATLTEALSEAVFFVRSLHQGKTVVMEPDPERWEAAIAAVRGETR